MPQTILKMESQFHKILETTVRDIDPPKLSRWFHFLQHLWSFLQSLVTGDQNTCSFWWWWLRITLLTGSDNWWSQTLAQNCNKRNFSSIDFPHFIHNFHFKLFFTTSSAQGSTIHPLSNFVMVYLQISVAEDLCRDPIHDHIQRVFVFSWLAGNKMLTTRLFSSLSMVISANPKMPPSSAFSDLLLF